MTIGSPGVNFKKGNQGRQGEDRQVRPVDFGRTCDVAADGECREEGGSDAETGQTCVFSIKYPTQITPQTLLLDANVDILGREKSERAE